MNKSPGPKYPQIHIRVKPDEMERIKDHARLKYARNVSTLVKAAIFRLLDDEGAPEQARDEAAA